jgi:hypothetical protein
MLIKLAVGIPIKQANNRQSKCSTAANPRPSISGERN